MHNATTQSPKIRCTQTHPRPIFELFFAQSVRSPGLGQVRSAYPSPGLGRLGCGGWWHGVGGVLRGRGGSVPGVGGRGRVAKTQQLHGKELRDSSRPR